MADRVLPSREGMQRKIDGHQEDWLDDDDDLWALAEEWVSGRLVDRKAMQTIRWCRHHNAEAMDALNTDEPKCWDAEPQYRCVIVDAALERV